ncbi:hypothetical protein E2562_004295 [Oryza meyeriana var. granulata]|uniref:Uncharacterized protein n=1 Tax=Oryza meyeriana var. granulata TaxID=110450 RepID=A0A6G1BS59_9ORYZ|nr:hypothetical protein E2562_004295 [Oryza meyeriana var. granulata]
MASKQCSESGQGRDMIRNGLFSRIDSASLTTAGSSMDHAISSSRPGASSDRGESLEDMRNGKLLIPHQVLVPSSMKPSSSHGNGQEDGGSQKQQCFGFVVPEGRVPETFARYRLFRCRDTGHYDPYSLARSRILALSSILPPPANSDIAALTDSDRPARALLRSPAAYAALSAALRSGGGADDPACHWLYDTLLSPDPDLRLAALAFLPLLSSLYLLRLPPALPSSLSGFEAVLLAVYSSEAKNRQGKPVLVQVPDLSVPSLYHTPLSSPSSKSPRRPQPPPIPPPPGNVVVGVLSPPLEPQAAVKSTKRAGIIGVAFEAYYAKISQMPPASKVDACNAVAAWAGQYCKCRFELDEKELDEEEADSLGSVSPLSSEAENGKALEEEMAKNLK